MLDAKSWPLNFFLVMIWVMKWVNFLKSYRILLQHVTFLCPIKEDLIAGKHERIFSLDLKFSWKFELSKILNLNICIAFQSFYLHSISDAFVHSGVNCSWHSFIFGEDEDGDEKGGGEEVCFLSRFHKIYNKVKLF